MEKIIVRGYISFDDEGNLLLNGNPISYSVLYPMIDAKEIKIFFDSTEDRKCFETMFSLFLAFGIRLKINEFVNVMKKYYSLIVKF